MIPLGALIRRSGCFHTLADKRNDQLTTHSRSRLNASTLHSAVRFINGASDVLNPVESMGAGTQTLERPQHNYTGTATVGAGKLVLARTGVRNTNTRRRLHQYCGYGAKFARQNHQQPAAISGGTLVAVRTVQPDHYRHPQLPGRCIFLPLR